MVVQVRSQDVEESGEGVGLSVHLPILAALDRRRLIAVAEFAHQHA